MKKRYEVRCRECGGEHAVDSVEFLNIESDGESRDIMHFVCPETGEPTQSFVFLVN